MRAQDVGQGATAHIALNKQHALTQRSHGLGKGDGDRSLALVGDRGGHNKGADLIVDGGKTNVGNERLGGVLNAHLLGVDPLLLGHV